MLCYQSCAMSGPVVLAVAVAAVAACSGGKTSDQELGELVVAPTRERPPIDVALAARDPGELGRALAMPHHDALAALGPHTHVAKSAVVVHDGAAQVDALTVETTIEPGADGAWHAVANNSADYGREAIWHGGALYLRPRYARWHRRAPNDAEEPTRLRDEYGAEIAAVWDLVAPGVALADKGPRTVAGRAGRVVELAPARSPRTPPPEPLTQRKWRESRVVEAVSGEVVLDAGTGAPLAARLAGKISFVRDGKRYTMTIDASHEVRDVGQLVAITLPPPDEVVATPERLREVDDRDALLKGIAPPTRAPDDPGAKAGGP
jgi:hypothetical protein